MKANATFLFWQKAILSAGCFLFQYAVYSQGKTVLVNNAKTSYRIVLAPGASAIEKEAADTLQAYLFRISGCKLPLVQEAPASSEKQLIIGYTNLLQSKDTSGLQEDGILIKKINNSIVFCGGYRKGVLYSVYTFLDSMLHCKMYAYDAIEIPETKTISLPSSIYIKQTPAFQYRMSGFLNTTKAYCDFNRQNYLYEGWGLWVHSFNVLVPPAIYFATHPEYFALVDGKRNPAQLCLSNPDVLRIVIQNLSSKIHEHPNLPYWSVSQNDNSLFCQCDACKKQDAEQGSHQGSLLTFVNKVARQFPDKTISTLAYLYSRTPPKTLQPERNVMIMLCDIDGDRSKPITMGADNHFTEELAGWQALTANILVWEYVAQFSHSQAPFPNLPILQPNVQYFKQRHVPLLFEEGLVNQAAEFSELKTYLLSKLMWNENENVSALKRNFIKAYYGQSSAPYIEKYIDLLTRNSVKSNAKLYIFGAPADQKNTFLTAADIEAYKAIFETALAKLPQNSIYYKRVAKEYASVLFADLDVNGAHKTADNASDFTNRTSLKIKLDKWYQLSKKAQINYLSEGLLNVDDYYNKTNQLLQQEKVQER